MIKSYLEKITLLDQTDMMSMANLVAINTESLKIDSGYSLEKDFIHKIYSLKKDRQWVLL